jgi:predicted RNA methylase
VRHPSFDRADTAAIVGTLLLLLSCSESASRDAAQVGSPEAGAASAPRARDTGALGTDTERREFELPFFDQKIVVFPGVFEPLEAQSLVLPMMQANPDWFRDKRVLEIGTGSGVIGLYAAKLGARSVVVTDINENAIASAKLNAERLGLADRIDQRLVSGPDLGAFAVIGPDEIFDVIISNPPYSLDLEAASNNAVTDTGDLGFSIVEGLDKHLSADGVAALFYRSLFYHLVMVKYARHLGYAVQHRRPTTNTAWETETLFNSYLARLLAHRRLSPDTFHFDRDQDDLTLRLYPNTVEERDRTDYPAGWMFIRRTPDA